MKEKQTITSLLIKGLLVFSILTILQGVNYLEDINKIWLAIISSVILMRLYTYHYTPMQLLVLGMTFVLHLIALYFTDFPLYHLNILFYFLLWMLLYLYIIKSKDTIGCILAHSDRYIRLVLWVWTLIVGISALFPSSYRENYFISLTGSSFRLMPSVLVISALAMYMVISKKNKKYNAFLILPMFAAFMNQSRTYFGIFIIFYVMYLYMRVKSKKNFYLMLLPLLMIGMLFVIIGGISDKIAETQYTENSYFDYWGTITSGRTIFWKYDIEAFFALPFWQQFVGNGFNFVYDVSGMYMNNPVWAHNDIINLLMNFGYIGVALYLWVYCKMVGVFWPKNNNIPLFVKACFHGAVFINSMFNMSYTYFCAVIAYPLFLYVIEARYETDAYTADKKEVLENGQEKKHLEC